MSGRSRRRVVRAAAAVACVFVLMLPAVSASATPSGGQGKTNAHDITYIAMLVPHHQAAVEMAKVATGKAMDQRVRQFAAHIVDEQINQMLVWLHRRHAEPMPPSAPVREMEEQDLEMLRAATGSDVDMMFLMMMRPHHGQAVSESADELEHGRDGFARRLANTTKSDQGREISQMNDLLEERP
jgi:uncharacterized protein (DUF305 family)